MYLRTNMNMIFKAYRCAICGAEIYPQVPSEWAYKHNSRYYCSWHCMQQSRKTARPVNNGGQERTPNDPKRVRKVIAMMKAGKDNMTIAEETGLSLGTISYHRQRFKKGLTE